MSKLSKLTGFLDRLDEADIHYTLQSVVNISLVQTVEESSQLRQLAHCYPYCAATAPVTPEWPARL